MATDTVILDCARLAPSVGAIGYLARLQLGLRRGGSEMRLARADRDLIDLIELAGLSGVLAVEVERHPEEREQPGRVEEEGDLPDPAA
jgi:hypothetical protein